MDIRAIAAMSINGVIGNSQSPSGLPFSSELDMARFREKTFGHVVVMGRTTYELIGKPLANRYNFVLTSMPAHIECSGKQVVHHINSFDDVLDRCATSKKLQNKTIWVIGGRKVYEATMDYWQQLELTIFNNPSEGDTWMPVWENIPHTANDELFADGIWRTVVFNNPVAQR